MSVKDFVWARSSRHHPPVDVPIAVHEAAKAMGAVMLPGASIDLGCGWDPLVLLETGQDVMEDYGNHYFLGEDFFLCVLPFERSTRNDGYWIDIIQFLEHNYQLDDIQLPLILDPSIL